MSERAGPRAAQAIGVDIPGLDDLQGAEQLAAEELLPPVETRQGRQRHQQRARPEGAAVIAFDTPDRDHRGGIHPIAPLRARQRIGVAGEHRAPVRHPLLIDQPGHVVPDRRGELRLAVEQRQHARVGHEVPGVGRERRRGNARGGGIVAQAGEAGIELPLHSRRDGRLVFARRRRDRGDVHVAFHLPLELRLQLRAGAHDERDKGTRGKCNQEAPHAP